MVTRSSRDSALTVDGLPDARTDANASARPSDVWLLDAAPTADSAEPSCDATLDAIVRELAAMGFGRLWRLPDAATGHALFRDAAEPVFGQATFPTPRPEQAVPNAPRWLIVPLSAQAQAVAASDADDRAASLRALLSALRAQHRRLSPGRAAVEAPTAVIFVAPTSRGEAAFVEAAALGADEVFVGPAGQAEVAFRLRRVALVKQLYYREVALDARVASLREAAAAAQSRLRQLTEAGLVGVVETDGEGTVVHANAAFLAMVDRSAAEVEKRTLSLGALTPSMWRDADLRARRELRRGDVYRPYEKEFRRPDGSTLQVLVAGGSVTSPEPTGGDEAGGSGDRRGRPTDERVVSLVLDVSIRRAIDAERERLLDAESLARAEAERMSRLKDEFLATVSHELRTPLNAIVGWSDLLRGDTSERIDRGRALETISRNARAQSKMIEDILDMSRIINGSVKIEQRRTDLCAVATQSVDVLGLAASAKGLRVVLSVPERPVFLVADPERLQQVLTNLITNAIKFTPAGGSIDVAVTAMPNEGEASVSVSDTGIGISDGFLPAVFERFRQADGSSSRRKEGLGLGLSIVRHIVELHGGRVVASSLGVGRGATFVVTLPLPSPAQLVTADADFPHAALLLGPEGAAAGVLRGLRVLVVDDTEDSLNVTTALLEGWGCLVTRATSAALALTCLDRGLPDLLLSDLAMPDEDGCALLRRVRARPVERGGQLPAVALSAYTREEDKRRALEAGFSAHLPKPLDATSLFHAISGLVGETSALPRS
jgi:PAS domain S-box-containing protein